MFDENFDTAQPPAPKIKLTDTMDRLFKTNNYKYYDPFSNESVCLFSYGGVDIHPDNPSPDVKTCQELITTESTSDETVSFTSDTSSSDNSTKTRSILTINDLRILHANNIFPQNSKYDFKAYINNYIVLTCKCTQFHNRHGKNSMTWDYRTYMKKNSNSSPWNTKPYMMNDEPDNDLENYVKTLKHSNED
jgi:hypothetical protein